MHVRTLSRIVIAKAVVALTLTAGAGGVALATTSTSLPAEDTETVVSTTAAPPSSDVHTAEVAAVPDADAEPDATPADPADANGSRGLTGLCRAWVAGARSNGKRDTNPVFSRLTAAASTPDERGVDVYCAALAAELPTTSTATPTTTPITPAPTPKPGEVKRAEKAADSATGKPAATDPNRGKGAEKSSGKSDAPGQDQSDSGAGEPAKGKKASGDE